MSNLPTLPPLAGTLRKPTPLPALVHESDARLQAALAASARAEASLTGLFRAVQQLGNGVGGAREANESLTIELEGLREMLNAASEQQHTYQRKLEQLEGVLDRTRKEAERERSFLIDQQDTFLVKLLDDQEAELKKRDGEVELLRRRCAELERRQLVTAPPPPLSIESLTVIEPNRATEAPISAMDRAERDELERTAQKLSEDRERARETVARLQAQRDEAQASVARISRERDEAVQQIHRLKSELGGPRIPLSTRPPPTETRRDSGSMRASLSLEQLEIEARLSRPTAPSPASSPTNPPISSGKPPPIINSVLSPPRSNPAAASSPLASRMSPPPSRLSPVPPRVHSPPPEELRRAITAPPAAQSSVSSRPPLKQKPDPSTRPLIGYALGNDTVETERIDHVDRLRLSSKPPGSDKR